MNTRPQYSLVLLLGLTVLALAPACAWAHAQAGVAGGLASGFMHPILGPDHVVAMVAVGLWGAQLGSPAIWALPITFPTVMAMGALLGIAGVPLPFVNIGVAASAIVLGGMVAASARPPLWIAAVIVGAFAVFHGYAHGAGLPKAINPLAYGVGFVLATGLLHLLGISFGLLVRWHAGANAVRVGGCVIALVGCYFLVDYARLIA